MKFKHSLLFLLSLGISNSFAQKKPIDHTVYDNWKSLSNAKISKTGNILFYSIVPQEGDATVEVKNKQNELILKVDRGSNPNLTHNETFFISTIKPTFQETRQAKIKKKKPDEMPKDSLLIANLQTQTQQKYPALKSYKLPLFQQDYLAFLSEIKPEAKVDSTDSTSTNKASSKKPKAETVLTLYHLPTGDTVNFWKADAYEFSGDGQHLIFSKKVDEKDSVSTDPGVYIYSIESKSIKKISNGKGNYKNFTFDDQSQQVVFLADKTPEKSLLKDFKVYYYTSALDTARIIAAQNSTGVPANWYVSPDGNLSFSANGEKLFLGLAPIPRVKDTTLIEFEHAKVDIWSWQDDYLQPQQLANLKRDQSRNYLAVVSPKQGSSILSLVDDTFNRVSTTDEANNEWVLASTDFGNRIAAQWQGSTNSDVYLISTLNGQKKTVKSNLNGQAYLSPDGKNVVYFDRETGNWFSYSVEKNSTIQLNANLPVSFVDEENDVPALPGSYGIAAWSTDGNGVYINDRYDIWYFDFVGKEKKNVTQAYGRINNIVLRYQDFSTNDNPRYRTSLLNKKGNIYLDAFDTKTKFSGLFQTHPDKNSNPKEIVLVPFTIRQLSASTDLEHFIYTKENYELSPNLFYTTNFKNETRVTDINPQQQDYNWGTAELVNWVTPNGHEASGILYKPENFDPNKKYPIIAYFYEKLSDGLYSYQAPAPTPSRLNIPYFVSNEYLVFAPDISYEDGYPGKSAEEYINSGMRYLAQNSWVDSTKMGIQGQSWGGYQVAHLITRTNMYAAAWTGAPVVNMTSAYGGIRWQSGMSRQFQYENTQSRIGKTLWENRELYIENSPLFFMDKVNTPVVIMANDNDGAVPWYQGIEMFTALRRLQKPVWMLNYNGDEHNLMQRQNRKDIQIREAQFFDHYLKGTPAPNWMKSGVPAINKGIDWGFEYN
ncbi:S9 family peptidase [Sphingobacterium hungaricum]